MEEPKIDTPAQSIEGITIEIHNIPTITVVFEDIDTTYLSNQYVSLSNKFECVLQIPEKDAIPLLDSFLAQGRELEDQASKVHKQYWERMYRLLNLEVETALDMARLRQCNKPVDKSH
jgi:hypothetical protein